MRGLLRACTCVSVDCSALYYITSQIHHTTPGGALKIEISRPRLINSSMTHMWRHCGRLRGALHIRTDFSCISTTFHTACWYYRVRDFRPCYRIRVGREKCTGGRFRCTAAPSLLGLLKSSFRYAIPRNSAKFLEFSRVPGSSEFPTRTFFFHP
jgi:hypothetical protein